MLSAAVRELKTRYPERFLVDVRTACPDLWANNPHLSTISDDDPEACHLECHYPLVHGSNQRPLHFIHGPARYLAEQLDVTLEPQFFRGDLYLSEEEMMAPRQVQEPYWIICAGGKYDFTIKWWHRRRWQEVVDYFQQRVRFVQIGERGHYHPPLQGVIDLRGRTTLRQLVLLVHHAEGVLCPVTLLMHLAAATPRPKGVLGLLPCVIVAGAREPVHWEAYPGHQFLHTVGTLPCCARGGCWRSRTVPLGDRSPHDEPERLCVRPRPSGLPECMEAIEPRHVIHAIEWYIRPPADFSFAQSSVTETKTNN